MLSFDLSLSLALAFQQCCMFVHRSSRHLCSTAATLWTTTSCGRSASSCMRWASRWIPSCTRPTEQRGARPHVLFTATQRRQQPLSATQRRQQPIVLTGSIGPLPSAALGDLSNPSATEAKRGNSQHWRLFSAGRRRYCLLTSHLAPMNSGFSTHWWRGSSISQLLQSALVLAVATLLSEVMFSV